MSTLTRGVTLAACSTLALSANSLAQCSPWALSATTGPSPRQNHAMVYDGAQVMLFGGYRGGVGFNAETWIWDGESWAMSPATGPSARANFAMAADPTGAILFGGFNVSSFGDTWEWDGSAWTQLAPASAPSARYNHAMAYDAAHGRFVLFGGWTGSRSSETWLFDGSTWTQAFPASIPTARTSHAMTYDSARGRVVMFGGYRGGSIAAMTSFLSDTWEWDGSNWTLSPATGPAPRQYHAMSYDASRGLVILTCGSNINSTKLGDTWAYDGTTWTQLDVGTPGNPHDQLAMTYVPAAPTHTLVHGGYQGAGGVLADMWRLDCPPACDPDVNCDGAINGFDVEATEQAVNGDFSNFCFPSADLNGDGAENGFDIETEEQRVNGAPC